MPAKSEAQRRLMAIAEHNPKALYKENKGVLDMSKSQLHDFAATKGMHEKTPVHMLKREDISLEGRAARKHAGDLKEFDAPDYVSGRKSDRNDRDDSVGSFYKDHGAGNHHGEKKLPHDDTDISVKVFKQAKNHTENYSQED